MFATYRNQSISWSVLMAFLFVLVITLFSDQTWAFDAIGSDHARLRNSVIAEVGEAKEVPPPSGATWENQVYSLNSRCFTMFGYFGFWGFGGKSAMIVIDENKIIKVAIIEPSIGNVNVKLNPIRLIQCPSHATILPSCDGLSASECTKLLGKYRDDLQRKLKALGK